MATGTIDNLEHLESRRSERRVLSRTHRHLEARRHERQALYEIYKTLALTNQVTYM